MRIVQINTFPSKATGMVMMNIHKELLNKGHDSYVVYGRGRKPLNKNEIYIYDRIGIYYHGLITRLFDKTGFGSYNATKKLIGKLNEIKPDIIHLHNIHGYYINIEMLFDYIKKNNIKIVWTFHDCWPITGHCAYFDYVNCNKWKTMCYNCPQTHTYPASICDFSKKNYLKKKEIFNYDNMTLVTPSKWLANILKYSFLKNNEIVTINNGIDTSVFKHVESDFRNNHNLRGKKIILGVASEWSKRKGLDDFLELSKIIDDNTIIVLVGVDDKIKNSLPNNIIGIKRTNNVRELVEIYSSADIFFNPTKEDNYPTVNMEAIACGLPVYTYDSGGSLEIPGTEKVNSYKDIVNVINNIKDVSNVKIKDVSKMASEYIDLYKEVNRWKK